MAAKIITNFIAKALFKQKGAIANNKAVEFSANALEERLKRFNVDPNAIKSEGELNQVLSFIKQAEDQAFTDRFGSMLQGSRFGKSGDVVDMTGKKLDPNKGIMGGTQTTEETIKENLMKTDNPFTELVKATEKGPTSKADRLLNIDESLRGKKVPTTFSEDIERQYGLTLQGDETIQEVIDMISDINKNKKDFSTGGRAGYRFGLGPLFNFLNKKSPAKAYTDYLKSVKDRMKAGKEAEVAGEVIPIAGTGALITNQLKKKLKAMNEEEKKRIEKEAKEELKKDMESKANGGRIGYKSGLSKKFLELFKAKKTKPEGDKIYGVGGKEIDVADLKKSLGLDEATQKKDMENLEKKLQMIIGRDRTKHATGGRAGFANGSEDSGAPSIKLEAQGSKSGRQQIKDAPAGITRDEEMFNAILKADIPISKKIDVLSKLQYGKGRTRIEKDGQEIFLDEGGFKSRDVGLGFNKESLLEGSDSEGIGGTLMYNLETGEPEFTVGYKKKFNFAGGGRANFDEGGMSRRKFMKIMGGIATLPILGKYIKPAMPLIKKGAEITGPALDKIVETVMSAGKLISQSGKRLKELTTRKKLKDVEVEEDMMDRSYTIKTKDKTIYYKPGRQDEMGIDDDVIEVIEDTVTKKAGGGIARMLGE